MKWLVVKSWLLLVHLELVMRLRGFGSFHRLVKEQPLLTPATAYNSADICHAVDFACVLYFKQVLCLQRSAVTTILLRRNGWRAQMIIGIQMLPFKSHAWVEVEGAIVNDRPYLLDIYRVLERC